MGDPAHSYCGRDEFHPCGWLACPTQCQLHPLVPPPRDPCMALAGSGSERPQPKRKGPSRAGTALLFVTTRGPLAPHLQRRFCIPRARWRCFSGSLRGTHSRASYEGIATEIPEVLRWRVGTALRTPKEWSRCLGSPTPAL